MGEIAVNRTPLLIAAEINSIKEQTRKIMLQSSIEIGRRLVEAKSLLEHGEWGNWLKESVDYSQSTANNLMRIFEEYGADQLSLFGSEAKSQALGNLSYTQAVALLGISQDEREQFIEEHDLENMSTRELQQAIKDLEQSHKKNEELEAGLNSAKNYISEIAEERDKLQGAIKRAESERDISRNKISALEQSMVDLQMKLADAQASGNLDEVEQLKASLEKTDNELENSYQRIKELERQLKEKPIEVAATKVVEKIPEEIEQELQLLREKTKELEAKSSEQSNAAVLKYTVHFENLVRGFKDLLCALTEIKENDPEEHEKYKNAVVRLVGKMTERL